VKPTEKDLSRVADRVAVVLHAWIASFLPMLILIVTLPLGPSYYAMLGTPIYDGLAVYQVVILALPVVPGVLLLYYRKRIVLRTDFARAYYIGLVGRILRYSLLLVLVGYLPVLYASDMLHIGYEPETDPFRQLLQQLWMNTWIVAMVGLTMYGAAGVMVSYFNVFAPTTLAKLSFGQAKETRASDRKLKWIRDGLNSIRAAAEEFGLDFDSTWFKQHYAIRLFDGQNVDSDLDRVTTCLSRGESILAALGEMGVKTCDLFELRRTRMQRVSDLLNSVKGYGEFLVAIAAMVSLVIQVMLRYSR
jgi:hypothetical protein